MESTRHLQHGFDRLGFVNHREVKSLLAPDRRFDIVHRQAPVVAQEFENLPG